MEKISKSNKKHRYANQEIDKDAESESLNKSYEKWNDESVMIRMDSPMSNKHEKPPVFTQEFIKNLPEAIVKKILETRSECSVNFSRETRLLSQNNSCKGKIRELKEEIERLKLNLEDVKAGTQSIIEKTVKKKVLALEKKSHAAECELIQWKEKYEALAEKCKKLEAEREKVQSDWVEQGEKLRKVEENLKAFEGICVFSQIPIVKGKLEELERVQGRVQELDAANLVMKDKNFKLQKEFEVLQLEAKNKDNHVELAEMQVRTLEDKVDQVNLRVGILEQMIKDKERTNQDLLANFKLLQDELRRSEISKKKVKNNQGEVERLKVALAQKLLEKTKKGFD